MSPASKISIVVAVHDDRVAIAACLRGLWSALRDVPHEILVCYESDADTTLHGIAEMSDAPATLRLVQSARGRGAGRVLRAGFEAALGDVVVTTTCAVTDRPENIPRMAEIVRREKLALVVGTGDVLGGSRTVLPPIESGATARLGRSPGEGGRISASGVECSLRAYSKEFLSTAWADEQTDTELALELAVKAHLRGHGVGQVHLKSGRRLPRDNRFQPWKWTRSDLRRWSLEAWQPLVAWVIGIVMSVTVWNYVATNASPIPMWDDMEFVPLVQPDFHWTVDEAWALHNEHRIPLPRMIGSSVYGWTHDIRTMMFVDVGILIGLSFAMMLLARKIRGRTLLVDALFPLLWLHTGNSENLLMGFQIALILPTLLVSGMVLIAIARPRTGLTWREAIVIGLGLLALPLCGGPGITQAPPIALALAISVIWALRRRDRKLMAGAAWTTLFLALFAGLLVLYMIGFVYPDNSARSSDPILILGAAIRVASLAFGEAGRAWWPWSGYAILSVIAVTLVLLVRAWRTQRDERWRIVALMFGFAATSTLMLSIGYGRSGGGPDAGFAMRYVTLPAPLIATVAFAWILYGGRRFGTIVPGALALTLFFANVYVNTPAGAWFAQSRKQTGDELLTDLKSGMLPAPLLDKWTERIYPDRGRLFYLLTRMAKQRLKPFDELPDEVRNPYTWFMFNLPPTRVETPVPIGRRWINGVWEVLMTPTGSDVYFEVPAKFSRLNGSFGMLPKEIEMGKTPGVRVIISAIYGEGAEREILVDKTLDPVRVFSDRTAQPFSVAVRPAAKRQLVLSVSWPEGVPHNTDWAYWGDLGFQ